MSTTATVFNYSTKQITMFRIWASKADERLVATQGLTADEARMQRKNLVRLAVEPHRSPRSGPLPDDFKPEHLSRREFDLALGAMAEAAGNKQAAETFRGNARRRLLDQIERHTTRLGQPYVDAILRDRFANCRPEELTDQHLLQLIITLANRHPQTAE